MTTLKCSKNDIQNVINHIDMLYSRGINVFLLWADLGVGKTYLIDKYVKSKGAVAGATSPSFSFINEYAIDVAGLKIYHYDIYLKNDSGFKAKLLESLCQKNTCFQKNIHFIEWGDEKLLKTLQNLGFNATLIEIVESESVECREYRIY